MKESNVRFEDLGIGNKGAIKKDAKKKSSVDDNVCQMKATIILKFGHPKNNRLKFSIVWNLYIIAYNWELQLGAYLWLEPLRYDMHLPYYSSHFHRFLPFVISCLLSF
ncbi:hypothetical protein HN51_001419 [Arachis hypogaea]|nr:uncharacterized protein DS421_1g14470 [Arachis hypogaea]